MENIMFIIVMMLIVAIAIYIAWYGIKQNKSIIERARKIDPTVNTITEAHYVLEKDIAESFGKNKDNK